MPKTSKHTQLTASQNPFTDCSDESHLHAGEPMNIHQRLDIAKQHCLEQGLRFTPLREQVFRLILQSHTPIGAYELLAQLQKTSEKPLAPPTVYRSLDFLLAHGFIHQLSSTNAFFPCCQPNDKHMAAFLICQHCGDVQEFSHSAMNQTIDTVAQSSDFMVKRSVIELLGLCKNCQT